MQERNALFWELNNLGCYRELEEFAEVPVLCRVAPDPSPRPVLRIGYSGTHVKYLQQRLNCHRVKYQSNALSAEIDYTRNQLLIPLKIDGIFGPKTRKAVLAFQEGRFLETDGVVGPVTWGRLNEYDRTIVKASFTSSNLKACVNNFKDVFVKNPKFFTTGQFYFWNYFSQHSMKLLIDSYIDDLIDQSKNPGEKAEILNLNTKFYTVVNNRSFDEKEENYQDLIENLNRLIKDYPHMDFSSLKEMASLKRNENWAKKIYGDFLKSDLKIEPPLLTDITFGRANSLWYQEKNGCSDTTQAAAKHYYKVKPPSNVYKPQKKIAIYYWLEDWGPPQCTTVRYHSDNLESLIKKIKTCLDNLYLVMISVVSGAKADDSEVDKNPEEHFLLILGYQDDKFVFWDSDCNGSVHLTDENFGKGFGILYYLHKPAEKHSFSTASSKDDLDIKCDPEDKYFGNHLHNDGNNRHRYQLISAYPQL